MHTHCVLGLSRVQTSRAARGLLEIGSIKRLKGAGPYRVQAENKVRLVIKLVFESELETCMGRLHRLV